MTVNQLMEVLKDASPNSVVKLGIVNENGEGGENPELDVVCCGSELTLLVGVIR